MCSLALGLLVLAGFGLMAPHALAATGMVSFSGYRWAVKNPSTTWGPGPNNCSSDNVSVDAAGRLHLRITRRQGKWYCAEVTLDHGLGYGTYRFTVASPIGSLDPNVILGLFTWSDDPAQSNREIDIEMSRWGSPTDPTNAQYVVQPANLPGHLTRFTQPNTTARTVHGFSWLPGRLAFASATAAGAPIAAAAYAGGDVPTPGTERVHLNLWLFRGLAPTNGSSVEVVLSSFAFTPATPAGVSGPGPLRAP